MRRMMMTSLLLLSVISGLRAEEIGVVAVSDDVSTTHLSREELVSIFLGKQTNWPDGRHIRIGYDTRPDAKTDSFFEAWVGKSHRRFKKYWVKKVFSGYGVAPRMFKSSQRALEYVRQNEGAIVYVSVPGMTDLDGVKTVAVDGRMTF